DARHGYEERYAVRTAPPFRLRFDCNRIIDLCAMDYLTLDFTAPVRREDVQRFVRLEPAAPLELAGNAPEAERWIVTLGLQPRTTYTMVIDEALRDVHGRALMSPRRVQVATGDLMPSVAFARGTLTVPWSGTRTIPLRHVNARTVRVVSYPIPESQRARALSVIPERLHQDLPTIAGRPDTTIVTLPGAFNVVATTELALPARVVGARGDLFAVRVEIASSIMPPIAVDDRASHPTRGDDSASHPTQLPPMHVTASANASSPQYALVQLTDLAVHARIGSGEGTVLVTGLTDGRARAGVTVRHLDADGAAIGQAMTDTAGVARLELAAPAASAAGTSAAARPGRPISDDWPSRVRMIEAVAGDDRVVTPLGVRALGYRMANPLDPSRLGGRVSEVPPMTAAIFPDRGIYRPGEMLYLKAVAREGILGALTTPELQAFRLTVTRRSLAWHDDDDVVVHDTVLTSTEFGTIADSIHLRPGLTLGDYEAELHVGRMGAWSSVASTTVRLAEYRAPEFLVETLADSTPRYGGDTVRVDAAARYLFGTPMARATVSWSAELHEVMPWELRVPGAEGWTVGEWDRWRQGDGDRPASSSIEGDDTLDASGRMAIHVPIAGLRPSRPGRMEVEVAVTDLNRQVISSRVSVPVHPARLYVLARRQARGWFWTVGQRATAEIRAVRPDGSGLPGVPVVVTVVRLDWRWDGRSGRWTETPVRTDTVRTGEIPVPYAFVPSAGGAYDLRLSASDGQGGTARTTLSGYAMASGSGWWAESPYHLPLVAGTPDVVVGEEAQVAFDSPFEDAEAWVTIERERVLERRRMAVRRGTNVVTVRIVESHVPNVFVSVLLLRRGGRAAHPDSAAQLVRVGYAELRVSTTPKRLTVAVTPRAAEYRPGDTAVVGVRVKDALGRGARSEVTLWA
ncbi:MAG TPA: MG2 domain-containing protein, partial [Gemmatimonadaceae bacterium]|nr:MG2 domain-containing protein [Gemmatimonadaceae bacterium]